MKIETKFSLFDKAYAMLDNKVYSFDVEKIEVYITPSITGSKFCAPKVGVVYYDYQCRNRFDECDCFASKEELIASL